MTRQEALVEVTQMMAEANTATLRNLRQYMKIQLLKYEGLAKAGIQEQIDLINTELAKRS